MRLHARAPDRSSGTCRRERGSAELELNDEVWGSIHAIASAFAPCGFDCFSRRLAERINFHPLTEQLAGIVWLAVLQKTSQQYPINPAPRFGNEIALRNEVLVIRLIVAGWQHEVFASLPLIGTRRTKIHDVSREGIDNDSRTGARRDLDNGRSVSLQIEKHRDVDRVRIAGKEQRIAVHQLVEDDDLMSLFLAQFNVPASGRLDIGRRHSVQKGVNAPVNIQIVQ